MAKGLEMAALLAIAMYIFQGFVGYPLTAALLKKEGRGLLKAYRSGEVKKVAAAEEKTADEPEKKKLIPAVPEKFFTSALALLKVSLVALLAFYIGSWTGISGAVWALILGIVFTELGFLDRTSCTSAVASISFASR